MKWFFFFVFLFTFLSTSNVNGQRTRSKLGDPRLLTRPRTSIVVSLTESLDTIYGDINSRAFSSETAKRQALTRSLQTATRRWQRPILEGLEEYGVEARPMWISNQIFIKDATPAVIAYLTGLPSVRSVEQELVITLQEPASARLAVKPNGTEWNVERVGAPEVWNRTRGENATVAIIDTGVRLTHEALRDSFVGLQNNGWFDPIRFTIWPNDNAGHGTHCAGIACGRTGTGVAPRARWMACRACDILPGSGGLATCPQYALLWCGQYALCPTNVFGGNANCSLAPDVVSNSWTLGKDYNFYNDVIRAWNSANIIGVFAIGNSGPECQTAMSPGDREGVISVGSTNIEDDVSTYSSRGPAGDGRTVPTIVAPGENINSAYIFGDDNYELLSGTSMACPAVAGCVALLKSVNKNITLEEASALLYSTAVQEVGSNTDITQCEEPQQAMPWPNNVAGNGRVNIAAAFDAMDRNNQTSF